MDNFKNLNEQEKKDLAERISSQFEYCELILSKANGEIRSIKGTFEIRFPSAIRKPEEIGARK